MSVNTALTNQVSGRSVIVSEENNDFESPKHPRENKDTLYNQLFKLCDPVCSVNVLNSSVTERALVEQCKDIIGWDSRHFCVRVAISYTNLSYSQHGEPVCVKWNVLLNETSWLHLDKSATQCHFRGPFNQ